MIDDEAEEGEDVGILSLLGGEESSEEELEESPKSAALSDFFAAGKSGDMAAAAEAFQRMVDLCSAKKAAPEASEDLEEY